MKLREIAELLNGRITGNPDMDISGAAGISDAGVAHLRGLAKLHTLDLSATAVTDSGLIYLAGLSNLRDLDLKYTLVTGAGVAKLQAALPDCDISASPPS